MDYKQGMGKDSYINTNLKTVGDSIILSNEENFRARNTAMKKKSPSIVIKGLITQEDLTIVSPPRQNER